MSKYAVLKSVGWWNDTNHISNKKARLWWARKIWRAARQLARSRALGRPDPQRKFRHDPQGEVRAANRFSQKLRRGL
jgi:hypothetical protein